MSDTVKIIIEIPKEAKQCFDEAISNDLKGCYYDHGGVIGNAIKNGIPLDDVKAEIDEQYDRVKPYNIDVAQGLEIALDILDNIGKAESEE